MENTQKQEFSDCDILKNAAGEILLVINSYEGGAENPRFVYDGGAKALLYRSKESSIVLRDIDQEARPFIRAVSELMVVEVKEDEVIREYNVPVRIIKNLDTLEKFITASA